MKRNKKRFLSIVLTLCMLVMLMPQLTLPAAAETSYNYVIIGGPGSYDVYHFESGSDTAVQDSDNLSTMAAAIGPIKTAVGSGSTTLIFGASITGTSVSSVTGTLDIGANYIDIGASGTYTIKGGLTGSHTFCTLYVYGASVDVDGADVANTNIGDTIYNSGAGGVTVRGGTVTSTSGSAIHNRSTGKIIISGGEVTSQGSDPAVHLYAGTAGEDILEISGGIVQNTGTSYAIYNYSVGKITISGGTVTSQSTTGTIYLNSGTSGQDVLAVSGGTLTNESGNVIYYKGAGNINISDGTFEVSGNYNAVIDIATGNTGNINISGGSLSAAGTSYAIYNFGGSGNINISGGLITAESIAVDIYPGASVLNISGGTVESTGAYAVYNSSTSTINITGGTVTGGTYGVYNVSTGYVYLSSDPSITGVTAGIWVASPGKVVANDGEASPVYFTGNPVSVYYGASITPDTTIAVSGVSGNSDKFTCANAGYGFSLSGTDLVINRVYDYVISGPTGNYSIYRSVSGANSFSLQASDLEYISYAMDPIIAAVGTGTAIVYFGASMSEGGIENLSDTALDIGANYINIGASGTYTIKGGLTGSSSDCTIRPNGASVIVDGATLENTNTSNGHAIKNLGSGSITVQDGAVTSAKSNAIANNSTGKVTITGGTVGAEANYPAIYLAAGTSGTEILQISGGTVQNTGTSHAVYNNSTGKITITGGTVGTGGNSETIYLFTGMVGTEILQISGGTVQNTGTGTAVYNNGPGNIIVQDGAVTSADGCAIANRSTGKITITGGTVGAGGDPTIWLFAGTSGTEILQISGGTVQNTGTGKAVYNAGPGNITVQDCVITSAESYAIYNGSPGTVSVSGTLWNAEAGTGTYVYSGGTDWNATTISSSGEIRIEGGTVSGEMYTIESEGGLIISGGEIIAGDGCALELYNSATYITGGKVTSASTQTDPNNWNCGTIFNGDAGADSKLYISGGTIENTAEGDYPAIYNYNWDDSYEAEVHLSGSPTVTGSTGVWTNTAIYANDGAGTPVYYGGAALNVYYGGTITSGTTVAVTGVSGNSDKFTCANAGYQFSLSAADLVITAVSTDITAAGVTGITAPAAGGTPQAYGTLTAGAATYSVTGLDWLDSDGTEATLTAEGKFKADTVYKARIELTSATDYKFQSAGLTPTVNAGTAAAGTVSGGDVSGNTLTFLVTFAATAAPSGNTTDPRTITVDEISSDVFDGTDASLFNAEADMSDAFSNSVVIRITDSDDADAVTFELAGADGDVFPFDISLYIKGTTTKTEPADGYSVTITLPLPEALWDDLDNLGIACLNDGELTNLEFTLVQTDGVWCIVFEADHFSPYALVVNTAWENPYIDVIDTNWFYDAVKYVTKAGLMNGTDADAFSPYAATSRAMVVTVLWRLEGEPDAGSSGTFPDVAEGRWYASAVEWAAANGIVTGYTDGNYGPGDVTTREQLAAILYRYAVYKGYDVSVGEETNILSYNDAFSISEYAIPAIQWACGAGLMEGSGGNIGPRDGAQRAQLATLLMRLSENVVE